MAHAGQGLNLFVFPKRPQRRRRLAWLAQTIISRSKTRFSIIDASRIKQEKMIDKLRHAELTIVWNPNVEKQPFVMRAARSLCRTVLACEYSFTRESTRYAIDPGGNITSGDSSLMNPENWRPTEQEKNEFAAFAERFRAPFTKWTEQGQQTVLVLLQREDDPNIYLHSDHKTMAAFIQHAVDRFGADAVVVRPHPGARNQSGIPPEIKMESPDIDIRQTVQTHRLVYGQTSTALYEAAIMGAPIEAIGRTPIALSIPDTQLELLSTMYTRSFSTPGTLEQVLFRYGR